MDKIGGYCVFEVLKCAPCPEGMISTNTFLSTYCQACADQPSPTIGKYYRNGESRIFFDKQRFKDTQAASDGGFIIDYNSFGFSTPSEYNLDTVWPDSSYVFVSMFINYTTYFKGFFKATINGTQISLDTDNPTISSKSGNLATLPALEFELQDNYSKLVWKYNNMELLKV